MPLKVVWYICKKSLESWTEISELCLEMICRDDKRRHHWIYTNDATLFIKQILVYFLKHRDDTLSKQIKTSKDSGIHFVYVNLNLDIIIMSECPSAEDISRSFKERLQGAILYI